MCGRLDCLQTASLQEIEVFPSLATPGYAWRGCCSTVQASLIFPPGSSATETFVPPSSGRPGGCRMRGA